MEQPNKDIWGCLFDTRRTKRKRPQQPTCGAVMSKWVSLENTASLKCSYLVGLRGLEQVTKSAPDGKGWRGVIEGGKAGSREDLLKEELLFPWKNYHSCKFIQQPLFQPTLTHTTVNTATPSKARAGHTHTQLLNLKPLSCMLSNS